jgi:hypothetical protein
MRRGSSFRTVRVRRECLDRMLIFGRRHLEQVLVEYVSHYSNHRPQRALGQLAPLTMDSPPLIDDPEPAGCVAGMPSSV